MGRRSVLGLNEESVHLFIGLEKQVRAGCHFPEPSEEMGVGGRACLFRHVVCPSRAACSLYGMSSLACDTNQLVLTSPMIERKRCLD